MRYIFLVLAWVSPALIAGMLGWKGVWGSGSALIEYLIPIPVAAGVFHLPSFFILTTLMLGIRNLPTIIFRYLPILAFSIFIIAQSLQLDFDRISAWLFTDYSPSGSPFRFGDNPFYLFVASDAFWLGIYSLIQKSPEQDDAIPSKYWLILPLLPVVVTGFMLLAQSVNGPTFKMGGSMPAKIRGNQFHFVYTSSAYDEKAFMKFLRINNYFARPWNNPNYENSAVIFTHSMEMIKWQKFDLAPTNTVGTICLYESDRSITSHKGFFNCFKGHPTVSEKLNALREKNVTGQGK